MGQPDMANKFRWKNAAVWPWGVIVGVGAVVLAFLWTTWPRVSPRVSEGVREVPAAPSLPTAGVTAPAQAVATSSLDALATATQPTLPVTPRIVIPAKDVLTVTVLNGSGAAGSAGKVADLFRGVGYVQVTAGNADAFTYRGTTIRYRPGLRGAAEDLARLLREQSTQFIYQEFSTSTPPADVVVIVGK